MKALLPAIFILFSLNLAAQGWVPLNKPDQYNFQINDAEYISNVIWIDSMTIDGEDTIYHLNRVLIECDTCSPVFSMECIPLAPGQGQFLQKNMTKKPGGIYTFEGSHNFTLHTLGNMGESWMFDDNGILQATIVDATFENVFSQQDSVKTIELSNGQVIRISKNHGILQFPQLEGSHYYSLLGIQNHNIGAQMPEYQTIYNYEIGDVLQYEKQESYTCSSIGNGAGSLKISISNKSIYEDSIVYEVIRHEKYVKDLNGGWNVTTTYTSDTLNWVISEKSVFFSYPGNYQKIDWQDDILGIGIEGFYLELLKNTGTRIDSNGRVTIYNYDPYFCKYSENYHAFLADSTLIPVSYGGRFDDLSFEVANETGLVSFGWIKGVENCMSQGSIHLTGYIFGQDTFGIVLADSIFVGTIEQVKDSLEQQIGEVELLPFQNPVKGQVRLNFKQTCTEKLIVKLHDGMGQLIHHQIIEPGANGIDLELSGFPNGCYLVEIKSPRKRLLKKILKF